MFLEEIKEVGDIKKISPDRYDELALEIRKFLIEKLSKLGGHLASNLGVVELTMALHLCLDLPKDMIVWDVGHQSYTHKILSGRKDGFDNLRQYKGMSGFPKTNESKCDCFNTGHSTTSISAGLGLVYARDLNKEDKYVVSVIGDGSLTGGMAYEALNNAARLKKNYIIVLNDNNMSISKNVGGISNYLTGIRTGKGYNKLKKSIISIFEKVPFIGDFVIGSIKNTKDSIKQLIIPGMFFENMGITYLGPIDGHNITELKNAINYAKKLNKAVLLHVITKKGKGYVPAENKPDVYHGVGAFDPLTGEIKSSKSSLSYSDVFSQSIVECAESDKRICAITAAMPDGTGLSEFEKKYPERFFDVGIAEAHGVTFAAGLAKGGLKPVVAIYSSFLQRGFDQILHDVCMQNLPVVFAIDRAGIVGADGETHQGIFDISYLSLMPNMTIFAPKNDMELKKGLKFLLKLNSPSAIRYPRGKAYNNLQEFDEDIIYGKAEIIYKEKDIAILALGTAVSTAINIRKKLYDKGYKVSLINMRFAKPIDCNIIDELSENHDLFVFMEENVINGSMSVNASNYLNKKHPLKKSLIIALPDEFIEHGDINVLRKDLHIDSDSVCERIEEEFCK